ncbi:ABC transporter permease [Pedobacter zeae]|uniref:ABC transporter permease n=1 Tax=Pedobacter zeae TaxID=1737356 RepID=A0A7W6P6C3_9SPHI|nr:FtsX-like permease family protein [Pedobacter zeae]MBB4107856.1 putative ABC transport system permease protein [Pedobacter zeae]GGG96604.1 ABC transporter permease [Pedobacter zeae]
MNTFKISSKNLVRNKLTTILNIILVAFGVGILSILLLAANQIGNTLEKNARGIDLVVGAKGSPLQLILSSIYHIDYPTGNIPAKDAYKLAHHPMVKRAVPLALGDNYNGYRIVGTDTSFTKLYSLSILKGNFWQKDLEVTIGSTVASESKLKIGDSFFGAHGLTGNGDIHKQHAYTVKGILKPQGNITDNLILTNIGSVYKMHEEKPEHSAHHAPLAEAKEINDKQITALLIQYKSPMSVILFPRMVNQSANMQAASPAMESARLFSLIGVGIDTLQWFAVFIMAIAALSIFISLYNAMKERKYDLALMRCLGASKSKLFFLVLLEGIMVTLIGACLGLLIGHAALEAIGSYQESSQAKLTGLTMVPQEIYLIWTGLLIGALASIIPAMQIYKVDIATTLTKDR